MKHKKEDHEREVHFPRPSFKLLCRKHSLNTPSNGVQVDENTNTGVVKVRRRKE